MEAETVIYILVIVFVIGLFIYLMGRASHRSMSEPCLPDKKTLADYKGDCDNEN